MHQHIRVSRRARTIPARPGLRNRLLPRDTPLLRLQPGLLRPPEAQLQLGGALGNRLQPLRTGGRAATSVGALQRTDQAAGGLWAGPVTEPGVAAAKQRTLARRDRRASISACSRSSSRCLRRFAAVSGSLQWGEASDRCQCWRQQPQGRNRSPVWRQRWLATGASCRPRAACGGPQPPRPPRGGLCRWRVWHAAPGMEGSGGEQADGTQHGEWTYVSARAAPAAPPPCCACDRGVSCQRLGGPARDGGGWSRTCGSWRPAVRRANSSRFFRMRSSRSRSYSFMVGNHHEAGFNSTGPLLLLHRAGKAL